MTQTSSVSQEKQASSVPPLLNRFMSALLRSPLHGIASRSVMLITFTGRKSGRSYTTPISYLREGRQVTGFTGAPWWRNLAGGAPVTLRIKGRDYRGWAAVVAEDKASVANALQHFLRHVRSDARFYQVTYDAQGEPRRDEVERAAERCVLLRITLNEKDDA